MEAGLEEQLRVALAPAAGMEEDQATKGSSGISRRQFLGAAVVGPQAVVQAMTGAPALPANPDQLLLYALGAIDQASRGMPARIDGLRHLATVLQQINQSAPPGQRPPALVAAIDQYRAAITSRRSELPTHAPILFLSQVVSDAPEHFDLARALVDLRNALKPDEIQFDPRKVFEAFRASNPQPLTDAAQRKAYLRPLVREIVSQYFHERLPVDDGKLAQLTALPADGAPVSVDEVTERVLDHVERSLVPDYDRSLSGGLLRKVRIQRLDTLVAARWDEIQREVQRRWDAAGVPASLRTGLLKNRALDRRTWEEQPTSFISDMEFVGRLAHRLAERGYLQMSTESLEDMESVERALLQDSRAEGAFDNVLHMSQLMSPEKRAVALQDPSKLEALAQWMWQTWEDVRRQETTPSAWRSAEFAKQRALEEEIQRVWHNPEVWEFPETSVVFGAPRSMVAPAIPASVVGAADQRLQPWQTWAAARGRKLEVRSVAWDLAAVTQVVPRGFVIYAPEPWWEALRAHWGLGESVTVAFASPEAMVPGAEGIVLIAMDDEMPRLEDHPVAIRLPVSARAVLSDEALSELTLSLMAYLANQSNLRGRVLLWTPESAQPLTWGQQQYLLLGAEA